MFGTGPESTDEIIRIFDRGHFELLAMGRRVAEQSARGLSEEIVDFSQKANVIYP